MSNWTFLTHHALVLLCVSEDPEKRLREIGDCVGITERAAHRIVCELEDGGYLTRERNGSRNHYEIHTDLPLRHDLEKEATVGQMLSALKNGNGKH